MGLLGMGGRSSNGVTFSSLGRIFCLEFRLELLWIVGRWSFRVTFPVFTKFNIFSLFFSSNAKLLFYIILSTEFSLNRCFGSISFIFLKSFLRGRLIFPINFRLFVSVFNVTDSVNRYYLSVLRPRINSFYKSSPAVNRSFGSTFKQSRIKFSRSLEY